MVRRNFAAGNQFIALRPRERQIGHSAAVNMADFPSAKAKLTSAKAMLSNSDTGPTQQFAFNHCANFNICFHR